MIKIKYFSFLRNTLRLFAPVLFCMPLYLQFYFPVAAQAQNEDLINLTIDHISKAESPAEAAREASSKVMAETAREQVTEMIGEKKFQKNRQLVETKLIREAAKFMPFVTTGVPVKTSEGFKVTVEMKLSTSSLKKMIQDTGLFFDNDGGTVVLPLVGWTDRDHSLSYRWWLQEKDDPNQKLLVGLNHSLMQLMYQEMSKQGFYLLRPQVSSMGRLMPEIYRGARPKVEDLSFWGSVFDAPMVLRGEIAMQSNKSVPGSFVIAIKLVVFQSSNGRAISEVSRNFETDVGSFENVVRSKMQLLLPDVAKDLSSQVFEAWQKGTIGSSLVQISVRGALTPKQLAEFKTAVLKTSKEVKTLRERLFEPNRVIFEADLNGSMAALSEKLKSLDVPGLQVKLADSSDKSLGFEARPR